MTGETASAARQLTAQARLALPLLVAVVAVIVFCVLYRRADRVGRARLMFLGTLFLILGCVLYVGKVDPILPKINKGLDLQGGIHVVLEARPTPENPVDEAAMRQSEDIIRERVDKLGVTEPIIQREGRNRIIVELPGVKDLQNALEILGKPAFLEFKDESGETVVTGADLKRADVAKSGEEYVVTLEFNPEGAKKFAVATERNVNKTLPIYLDGELISAPKVREKIPDGRAQITGYGSLESAYYMSVLLNSGALPVKLDVVENRSVSATLGADSIQRSLRAAIIGFAAVALFMMSYYKLPGLLADLALAVYAVIFLVALFGLRATLTLPGIAGAILSIGMAVDANVIVFERIKEEAARGKTLLASVEAGFSRALLTILDANITTLIAGAVLFYLGAGPVRGFAVTLSLGILASMFTAVVLTRYLLRISIRARWFKPWYVLGGQKGGAPA